MMEEKKIDIIALIIKADKSMIELDNKQGKVIFDDEKREKNIKDCDNKINILQDCIDSLNEQLKNIQE